MRLRLPQFAIYWARQGSDRYGRPSFADPVERPCRWEDKISEIIDAKGEKSLSSATVYLSTEVGAGGYLLKGRLADLPKGASPALEDVRKNASVREIVAVGNVPSLNGAQSLTTASLR